MRCILYLIAVIILLSTTGCISPGGHGSDNNGRQGERGEHDGDHDDHDSHHDEVHGDPQ